MDYRQLLRWELRRRALRRQQPGEPPFSLSSGGTSPFFVDCERVLHDGRPLLWASQMLLDTLHPHVFNLVGVAHGGTPLALGALVLGALGRKASPFYAGSALKTGGPDPQSWLRGSFFYGQSTCVVEDVVTTGDQLLRAISRCEIAGLPVTQAIALATRQDQQEQDDFLRRLPPAVDYHALFTLEEIEQEDD